MKEIFIFGAGASKASADTPLGSELVWYYHSDCSYLLPIIKGIPDTREDVARFAPFDKFLEIVTKYYSELKPEIVRWKTRGEAVYDPSSFLKKTLYVDEILQRLQEKGDQEGTEHIRKLIFKHLVGSSFDRSAGLYQEFIEKVLKDRASEDITIISFNFDFILHEDFKSGVSFDYFMPFDWVEPVRDQVYCKGKVFPLLKLNGSLDWGICQSCGRIHLYFHHMKEDFYDKQLCKVEGCKGNVSPFIVIPHQQNVEKIKGVWTKAQRELKEAQKVTVIGYSFPAYDNGIINLFKKSLRSDVDIEVVDYNFNPEDVGVAKKIESKYHAMFPYLKKDVKVSLSGFKGYLYNLNR